MKRLIVAITGASGALYGIRLLEWLRANQQIETHLMISDAGVLSVHHELDMKRTDIEALADVVHSVRDIGACVASGSFQSEGMIIAPCSVRNGRATLRSCSDAAQRRPVRMTWPTVRTTGHTPACKIHHGVTSPQVRPSSECTRLRQALRRSRRRRGTPACSSQRTCRTHGTLAPYCARSGMPRKSESRPVGAASSPRRAA